MGSKHSLHNIVNFLKMRPAALELIVGVEETKLFFNGF